MLHNDDLGPQRLVLKIDSVQWQRPTFAEARGSVLQIDQHHVVVDEPIITAMAG